LDFPNQEMGGDSLPVLIREFDVVTVPDFAGTRPDVFEIRTLFFLASWLASGNPRSAVRLHLACVGEPPGSVRRLADQANAIVSVHAPKVIRNVRCANKFRGFEVEPRTAHLLLIDTDVLFLGRLDDLTLPPQALAVAPAFKGRVKEDIWTEAYRAVGLEIPSERIWSQACELDCADIDDHRRRGQSMSGPMLPYYNAGVIFAPWAVPLAETWERHIERVNGRLEQVEGVSQSILRSDQTAFATTAQELRNRGIPLVRLPDAFHGHRLHLYRRKLKLEDIRLLHFTGSFSSSRWDADPRKWARISARHFHGQLRREYLRSDLLRRPVGGLIRCLGPAWRDGRRIGRLLDDLYLGYVAPAMKPHAGS
jgi:hypothetical protein